jgi:hypothetical protein
MVSFCDSGDTFCDSAGNTPEGIQIHLQYVQEDGAEATEFIISKVKAPSTVQVSVAAPGIGTDLPLTSLFLIPCLLIAAQFL